MFKSNKVISNCSSLSFVTLAQLWSGSTIYFSKLTAYLSVIKLGRDIPRIKPYILFWKTYVQNSGLHGKSNANNPKTLSPDLHNFLCGITYRFSMKIVLMITLGICLSMKYNLQLERQAKKCWHLFDVMLDIWNAPELVS